MAEIIERTQLKGIMINEGSKIVTVYNKNWKDLNDEVIPGTITVHQEDFPFELIENLPEYAAFIQAASQAFETYKIEQDGKA